MQLRFIRRKKHIPPANIATNITPQDQISAGVALYGRVNTSGATYGKVPHRLSSRRSLPFILHVSFGYGGKKTRYRLSHTGALITERCYHTTYYLNMVAIPKSDILMLSLSSSSRFSGFRSRCATPRVCK